MIENMLIFEFAETDIKTELQQNIKRVLILKIVHGLYLCDY